ncbi:hypothetical protein HAP94_24945 [Acidithiobacillus ferrivorans]|nr:hypothetical protein [Acidithiobacillus ferrivorans]
MSTGKTKIVWYKFSIADYQRNASVAITQSMSLRWHVILACPNGDAQ